MADAIARLDAILAWYQSRYPGSSIAELVHKIDAKIVQVLVETMDLFPIPRVLILGFAEMVEAIDLKLAHTGLHHFSESERTQKALAWMRNPETPVEKIMAQLARVDEKGYRAMREELWSQVPTPS